MLPTKAANACLKSLRQWRHGGTGGASQHVKDGETFHGETFQCANGGTGGASLHVKDAARELYKNVISAAWKETFQHIITSLALIYSPDDVVKMEKEICDAEPEDYAPLYSELFDKYETKRIMRPFMRPFIADLVLKDWWTQLTANQGTMRMNVRIDIDRLFNLMRRSPHFERVRGIGDKRPSGEKRRQRTLQPTELKPGPISTAKLLSRLQTAKLLSRFQTAKILSWLQTAKILSWLQPKIL